MGIVSALCHIGYFLLFPCRCALSTGIYDSKNERRTMYLYPLIGVLLSFIGVLVCTFSNTYIVSHEGLISVISVSVFIVIGEMADTMGVLFLGMMLLRYFFGEKNTEEFLSTLVELFDLLWI